MICRRCLRGIGPGEVHCLVARRPQIDAALPPSMTSVIVCTGCKRPDEKRYIEDAENITLPPPRLRPLQLLVLRHAAPGWTVYRQPRKIRLRVGEELSDTDRAITTDAYALVNLGLAEWDVVPKADRIPGGATAWLRLTPEGYAILETEEEQDVVEAGSR